MGEVVSTEESRNPPMSMSPNPHRRDPYFYPYFYPYNCTTPADTRRHDFRKSPVQTACLTLAGRPGQTMDIFEGTEQIQQGIIAPAISEGRIDPLGSR